MAADITALSERPGAIVDQKQHLDWPGYRPCALTTSWAEGCPTATSQGGRAHHDLQAERKMSKSGDESSFPPAILDARGHRPQVSKRAVTDSRPGWL